MKLHYLFLKLLMLFGLMTMTFNQRINAQCANVSNIYTFSYNGKNYEVVKENKNWNDASACAQERGGVLAEIDDSAEQNAVFNELNNNAGIVTANTTAPDGGGGSYVWLGGNDLSVEGTWVWNNGAQFWQGTSTGNPVGGLYNNWGMEPDDYLGQQDALGMSLNGWPLGTAGQWNDLNQTNSLYYVIEHPATLGVNNMTIENKVSVSPNPVSGLLNIETQDVDLSTIVVFNTIGQKLITIDLEKEHQLASSTYRINISHLIKGVYIVKFITKKGKISTIKKIIKK